MKAFIAGTSLFSSKLFENWDEITVDTPYGKASILKASQYLFLQRHGKKRLPPHKIPHHANIWALKSLGVEGIISINSVGSLKTALRPGTFIIPDDFVSFCDIPTFFDYEMRFVIPSMDGPYAEKMHRVCTEMEVETTMGGVYVQTRGPRFETKAEINVLKKVGDVVGMTMASEATLCMEYSIPYVSLCSIDNYCNGILKTPLTVSEVEEQILKNMQAAEAVVQTILGEGF
ncbi:MAG TPA: MTAP family purine nucleoside phosphorylase [Syntrophorhabdales bacterium]|nr:MTAP family purine nucleoside phosphorylase [Syntrophorhabdales bacterium]